MARPAVLASPDSGLGHATRQQAMGGQIDEIPCGGNEGPRIRARSRRVGPLGSVAGDGFGYRAAITGAVSRDRARVSAARRSNLVSGTEMRTTSKTKKTGHAGKDLPSIFASVPGSVSWLATGVNSPAKTSKPPSYPTPHLPRSSQLCDRSGLSVPARTHFPFDPLRPRKGVLHTCG